ncbi:MAG: metal-dependent transcriptional regulator [Armatimonadota bacterium]|nr:metal-dependent transcriptional regulator [Armatimonadota bacterium]MDR7440220.1 metal-dependent transcriptional regulator [Armatimonadota bacterium]MDR7563986.1 metal-dependent transcriptional regulator [Armatimonadota bacterium]MDR7568204.1 metal-dependent transcriptional regulator [Armatimonadota bacterium]MDR7602819.1 metal-dependent transcriptional regulator [Armatimonadota bacterium]
MTTHDIGKTERMEMYLKAVFSIQQTAPPATVSRVAEFMGVSVPSASEMLKRLEQQGYVRGTEDGVVLTPEGREVAVRVVRRLRLAERLLTDILGLELPRVYEEACKLEHVISPEVEARLEEVLHHPTHCPHGQPIPQPDGTLEEIPTTTLGDLRPGDWAEVAAIPEEDAELVGYLASLGLVPGTRILVNEIAPYSGPIFFEVNGIRRAIGPLAASRVRVRTL